MAAMRIHLTLPAILSLVLAGCATETKPVEAPAAARKAAPKPKDETHHFPKADQVEAKTVDTNILGKSFLPGGNLAHYKKGKVEWDMVLVHASGPEAAAVMLLDYKKSLTDAKFVAHFGGYAGKDGDRPAFFFTKGTWFAGILGLPEKDADLLARDFAARLD